MTIRHEERRGPKIVSSSMLTTDKLNEAVRELDKYEGIHVVRSHSAGTVTVKSRGEVVFRALAKGPRGPWICAYFNGGDVSWAGKVLPTNLQNPPVA